MDERTLFTSPDLTVTDARLIYRGRSYPSTAVKSFKTFEIPAGLIDGLLGSTRSDTNDFDTVEIPAGRNDPKRNRNAARILQAFAVLLVVLGVYVAAIGQIDLLAGVGAVAGGVAFFFLAGYMGKPRPRGDYALIAVQLTSGEQVVLNLDASDARALDEALASIIAPVVAQARPTISIADELTKLEALKTAGVLSPEDWERAKGAYLGKAPDLRERAVADLRSLYSLYRDGVLSESEFNIKKWEILSKQA